MLGPTLAVEQDLKSEFALPVVQFPLENGKLYTHQICCMYMPMQFAKVSAANNPLGPIAPNVVIILSVHHVTSGNVLGR